MGTLWIPIIVIIFVLCFIMLHQARYVDQCRFFPPYFFNPPTPFFGSSRFDADAAPHIPALTGKIRVPNIAQGDRIDRVCHRLPLSGFLKKQLLILDAGGGARLVVR